MRSSGCWWGPVLRSGWWAVFVFGETDAAPNERVFYGILRLTKR